MNSLLSITVSTSTKKLWSLKVDENGYLDVDFNATSDISITVKISVS